MNNNSNNKNNQHHHYGIEFSLFVGDLPYDCSDDKLQRLFQSKYKSVKRVQIIRNEDGSSRGFGFIRFEEKADFQAALAEGMKLDNTTLRLDTAHRNYKNNRTRYNSFNSSSSNNSNHHHHHNHHPFNSSSSNLHHQHHHDHQTHHHHHNQAPHQQHGSQQHHTSSQQVQNSKLVLTDQPAVGQSSSAGSGPNPSAPSNSRVTNQIQHTNVTSNSGGPNPPSGQPGHTQNQPQHNTHANHNPYNQSQQKSNPHHQGSDSRAQKALGHGLGGDESSSIVSNKPQSSSQSTRPAQHQSTTQASHLSQSQSQTQHNLPHLNPNATSTVTPSAVTSLPSGDISHSASALQSNQHNITGQPMLGPDMRAYAQGSLMDNSHMMGGPDPSMLPPSSVYGHMYPYGPPPTFGYMPPPPQPNPVIPVSAVPPAPPNQVSSSGVGHSLNASGTNRYNSPHQQQQHSHQTQPAHAAVDANAMNAMTAAGVQAQHQAPFYYYYPSPLYFDQTGASAPPNMYHPQSFHPQFFALPNPAYLPNAHSYPTHNPAQTPLASQSDANAANIVNPPQQQGPPPSLPPSQQQLNLRNRDIDAPIE